ncbi:MULTISPECIES: hypothetical protein [unclassified Variovorax]|uniref:hypothetical protein n=1 Tax=unclassified Variovorax TaxID=663243 RepID=UPI003F468AF1
MSELPRQIRHIVFLASLVAPAAAFACSPGKSIDVFFERNSSRVSAEQVLRLANWTAMLRERYPNRQAINMGANAEQGERDPHNLAMTRARNVARVLDEDLRFTVPTVTPPAKGYVYPAGALGKEDVKRVEIDFLPACPHECPCQTGDPLYKPPPQR